jgi:hypothetical protein
MAQANDRNLRISDLPGTEHASMAGDDFVITVDQDRNAEAEGRDAPGDLSDLQGGMLSRIAGIRNKTVGRQHFDPQTDRIG